MKKKTLLIWMSLLLLQGVLTIPLIRRSALAKPAAAPAEHPNYREAIGDLRSARKQLESAEADGYGHRDHAMRAIDRAIDECQQAVQALH